jgi:enterochelin esterase family protein
MPLARLGDSSTWFYTARVPKDSRFIYGFVLADTPPVIPARAPGPDDVRTVVRDPENPSRFLGMSFVEMPSAPKGPLWHEAGAPRGRFTTEKLQSKALGEEREVVVYIPPGAEGPPGGTQAGKAPFPLLLAFDAEAYGGGAQESSIPLPALVDRLVEMKELPPTVVALVPNLPGRRGADLEMSARFAEFIANEVIPLLRKKYGVDPHPEKVTLTGSSDGGLASAWIALRYPKVVGNVLSQSGAFWVSPGLDEFPWPFDLEPGALIREFAKAPLKDIHFYLEAGKFEGHLLDSNRRMRDVLVAKGYSVTYREFSGGHDYFSWRESIAGGLVALAASRVGPAQGSLHH